MASNANRLSGMNWDDGYWTPARVEDVKWMNYWRKRTWFGLPDGQVEDLRMWVIYLRSLGMRNEFIDQMLDARLESLRPWRISLGAISKVLAQRYRRRAKEARKAGRRALRGQG